MGVYEDWKRDLEKTLGKGFSKEKIPSIIKRCPRCFNLSLEFDIEKGKIICRRCGFEENINLYK